jgi:uncharacterized membrane protein
MEVKTTLVILHVVASVVFLGNIIFAFFWKITANKNGGTAVLIYAQKQLAWTDGIFTTTSTTVIAITGYSLAKIAGINVATTPWLLWSQILFYGSAAIWLLLLAPIQVMQLSLLKNLSLSDAVPEKYWSLTKRWNVLWIIATLLPLLAYVLMVIKPTSW